MAGKSQKSKAKHHVQSKKSRAMVRRSVTSAGTMEAPGAVAPVASSGSAEPTQTKVAAPHAATRARYSAATTSAVVAELKRIGILSSIILIILVVLVLVLR